MSSFPFSKKVPAFLPFSLLLSLSAFAMLSCFSSNRELLHKSYKLYVYAIDADEKLSGLEKNLTRPLAFSDFTFEQLYKVLGHLRYQDYHFSTSSAKHVFLEKDAQYITPRLLLAIAAQKRPKRLLSIYKSIPENNLTKTSMRNIMLMWQDRTALNVLFEDIAEPVISEDLITEDLHWHKIGDIEGTASKKGWSLHKAPPFRKKIHKAYEYANWLMISPMDIAKLSDPYVQEKAKGTRNMKKSKSHTKAAGASNMLLIAPDQEKKNTEKKRREKKK